MARKRSPEGKFTISGPLEEDHPAPTIGAAMSGALTLANRRRRDDGEFTYYVRDLAGRAYARATKHENGVISLTPIAA